MRPWLNLWGDLRDLPRASWTLALVTLINRAGTMVHPFLALHLTQNLGFSATETGAVVGLYGLASVVTSPLAGRLADRVGSLTLMRASLLLSGLLLWLLPLARTRWSMGITVVLLGAIAEAFRPANLALIGEIAGPEQRKRAFALNRLALNLGMSVGPALGGFLAMVSFPLLFWVDGATSILAGVLLLLTRIDVPPSAARPATGQAGVLRLLPDRRLLLFLAAVFPMFLVFMQHTGTLPLFLVRELGLSEAFYGSLFTFNTLIIVLFEVRLNIATEAWPVRRTLGIGAVLFALGFGGLLVARGPWSVIATVLIWTVAEMLTLPASSAYVAEIAPPGRGGEYMGLYAMCVGLALTVGPPAGLTLMERFGSTTLWATTLVIGLLSAGLLWRIREPEAERAMVTAT